MKPRTVIVIVLMCCLVYAIVRLSIRGSGTAATAAQAEAVTKVCSGFLDAVKNQDYEQVWNFM